MKSIAVLARRLLQRLFHKQSASHKLYSLIHRYRFMSLLIGSITIAIFLTIISITLYVATGTSKLDLSRPGYEAARKTVNTENDEVEDSYVLGRAFDKNTLTQFLTQYKKRSAGLKYYDVFDPKLTENEQLGLFTITESNDPLLPLPE